MILHSQSFIACGSRIKAKVVTIPQAINNLFTTNLVNLVALLVTLFLSCSSGHQKRVVGEGMPLVDDTNQQHGDLIIKFTVVFPPVLNQHQKALIRQALQ